MNSMHKVVLSCAAALVLVACSDKNEAVVEQSRPTVVVVPERACDADCQAVLKARMDDDARPSRVLK